MKNQCKIYKLINKVNGKVYIGQTWYTFEKRFREYRKSSYIYKAISKYGKENFQYELLALCSSQYLADYLEQSYIQELNSRDPKVGYNLKEGGSRGKCAEETKKKISEKAMGHKRNLGKHHSEKVKLKMSQAQSGIKSHRFGKKLSAETKSKISKAISGINNPFYGNIHSEEVKRKISKANKGKTWKLINGKRVWLAKEENASFTTIH